MTLERENQLRDDPSASLTIEEMRQGWHFCDEFDYLLTTGELMREDGVTCFCGFDCRKVGAEP